MDSLNDMTLAQLDPEIQAVLDAELGRQRDTLEMIASENFVPRAVLEAQGSVLTNKYAEGYPGRRYYGGCEFVDVAESLAIERAKQVFGGDFYQITIFIIYNHFNIRRIFKQHLTAVPAGRNDAVQVFFMHRNNGIKLPFSCGNGNAHGDVLRAGAMNTVAVHASVDFTVLAQYSAANRVIVDTVVEVLG